MIRGNLVIVLLESFETKEFEEYSFPELREISGYFLMMRVFGVRSLGRLFPNLSVIRGKQLLGDYSFVLFELLDLEEVGRFRKKKSFMYANFESVFLVPYVILINLYVIR